MFNRFYLLSKNPPTHSVLNRQYQNEYKSILKGRLTIFRGNPDIVNFKIQNLRAKFCKSGAGGDSLKLRFLSFFDI